MDILRYLILARALLSFLPLRENPLISFVVSVTEPIIAPFRALLSKIPAASGYGIDFSPLLALIVIGFVVRLLP